MELELFVEFYRRVDIGKFDSMQNGIEITVPAPLFKALNQIKELIIKRNKSGKFEKVNAFKIHKDSKACTPILIVA